MPLTVEIFECLDDNYGYLLHDDETGRTAALDAPEAPPIRTALQRKGWHLSDIFITHHHPDHTDGIAELKRNFKATVTGPRAEADKITGLDKLVAGGEQVALGATKFDIYDTPGHTLGHIVFHDPTGKHLFSADALFALGVGRMFEGTPGPMWSALATLRDLDDDTLIYFGHEYSATNAAFALSIDPDNILLKSRADEINRLRTTKQFTVPTSLGLEKATNPFLRADDPQLASRLNLAEADPANVFAAIRKAKDNF